MIEETRIRANCPTCKEKTEFLYIGRQKGFGVNPDFDLYNCEKCDSSFANETLGLELRIKDIKMEN